MNITLDKKQAIAIGAIAAAGIVLAALILGTGKSSAPPAPAVKAEAHAEKKDEHGHEEVEGRLELSAGSADDADDDWSSPSVRVC